MTANTQQLVPGNLLIGRIPPITIHEKEALRKYNNASPEVRERADHWMREHQRPVSRRIMDRIKMEVAMDEAKRLMAEANERMRQANKRKNHYDRLIGNLNVDYTRKDIKLIENCLHPDKHPTHLKEKYTEAIQSWQRIKKFLKT